MTNELTPTDPGGLARAEMERIDRERLAELERAREQEFRRELEHLINKYSKENGSDTPDFILASYLADCLDAFDSAVQRRNRWYRPDGSNPPAELFKFDDHA